MDTQEDTQATKANRRLAWLQVLALVVSCLLNPALGILVLVGLVGYDSVTIHQNGHKRALKFVLIAAVIILAYYLLVVASSGGTTTKLNNP